MTIADHMTTTASDYQICARCVMDTSDPDIAFDEEGVCSHCAWYDENVDRRIILDEEERKRTLDNYVARIKAAGRGKPYDCIIGVSGGVDSTYVAHLTKSLGLRPLAVHLDNGWNSEVAVRNIERVLNNLGIDLFTEVLNWEEFRDLQLSFLKASTPDGEVPTDHAIYAQLLRVAKKHNVRFIISGMNFHTEGSRVIKWAYGHSDWKYIRSVHAAFGNVPLKSYPHYGLLDLAWSIVIRRIRFLSILNYVDYQKDHAMEILQNDLGWVYYGGKHYESIYTRFYQAYILPQKFNIDKRRMHQSDLIRSGQVTREEALTALEEPICDPDLLARDRTFVLKKLGLADEDFARIMSEPPKTFEDYPNDYALVTRAKALLNDLRSRGILPR